MADTTYYEILQKNLPAALTVARLVHGVSWTAAVLSDGSVGVAMHTAGETAPRMFENLAGLPLTAAGEALLSWNMEEASEALAAVNAFYNRAGSPFADPVRKTLDGVDMRGRTVGMIGKMIGHSNMTEESFRDAKALYILEREEKPGTLPDSACEFVLPRCDLVIITGSAAINKTLPRLLELSRGAELILTGPSVSCCPALLELGIDCLHGRAVTDPETMLSAIVEKRCSVNPYSESFFIDAGAKRT